MQKRGGLFLKSIAVSEMAIFVISIFSFAFIISEANIVSAQNYYISPSGIQQVPAGGSALLPQGTTIYSSLQQAQAAVAAQSVSSPAPLSPTQTSNGRFVNSLGETVPSSVSGAGAVTYGFPNGLPAGTSGYNVNFPGAGSQTFTNGFTFEKFADGTSRFTQNGATTTLDVADTKIFETEIAKSGAQAYKPYQGPFGVTGGLGHLFNGVLWAAGVAGAIQLFGGLLGLEQGLTDALSIGAGAGIFIYNALESLGPTGFKVAGADSFFVANSAWIGLGAGILIFILLYKSESAKRVSFQCLPWEAPVGGKSCEQCNGDPFRPCSEYRCKALGQACEIVNAGTTDEKCVWVNPNDALSPTITPWDTVLTDGHRYVSHDTRPPALGTKIVRDGVANGCLKAFTPLTFGVLTNEPAQCKVDLDHKDKYDEMQFFFGNSNLFTYNHSQTFSLPSPNSVNAEAPEFPNDGKYDFFVRCRDKNGNENVDEYGIQFCVDPSPDTTPPIIVDTSITSGSAVRYGVGTVPLQVYVNEPAECKWSAQDKTYETMENSMACATSLTQINSRELYTCSTTLTGIADRQENTFYFRCKDKPNAIENERNVNVNSYVFKLRGSQPLNIIEVAPNGTITGSTQTIPVDLRVVTDDGADEGVAICSFSPTGAQNSYVTMFDTEKIESTQRLTLGTGNYNYNIRCVDLGGNAATANITFNVLVDTLAPLISRAYHDSANNALKIVTNENAACVYSLNSCNYNFNEGVALLYVTPSNKKAHYAEWQPNLVYYLKCKDDFGNEPAPNACSLVASASAIA